MAYHGYIPVVSKFAFEMYSDMKKKIKILEIGVDTGISLFALTNNLNLMGVAFDYTGVDVKIQPHISAMNYMFYHHNNETKINLVEQNSLDYLPTLDEKFDIILIDGDHNYETISQECKILKNIMHENTLIIADDYEGRWSKKDLYYSDKEGYEENKLVTKKSKEYEKHGVKPAIDEFIENNNNIVSFKLMEGEPIVLVNKKNQYLNLKRT